MRTSALPEIIRVSTDERPYCSQPAIHGDRLVFVTAGDLWAARLGERLARRLTTIAGTATRPTFSPDGTLVAFGARDDGPTGLHVMPSAGGEARRLVHHPAPCEPCGFTPDGARVLFISSLGSTNPRSPEIHSVSIEGGDVIAERYGPATAIAMHPAGPLVIGRGYQDPARWKRYAGGLAGRLWSGTSDPLVLRPITRGRRGESQPGFWNDRIVFLSDEDGCGNIWSCALDGSDRHQHTRHAGSYVRWPSAQGGRVAYQREGDVWLLDLASDRTERLDIDIAADIASTKRRYVDASRFLERAEPSPDGARVLVTARGKVASLPAWRGPARVLGDDDGVRYAHATWLPDGKQVALSHDASGEEEIEIRSLEPGVAPRSLGRAGNGRLRALVPSPDGRWIAISEMAAGLQLVELSTGDRRHVDTADSGAITDMSWSPDSRWLAYARPKRYRSSLRLHDVESGLSHPVTGPEFDDAAPCFDPAGRYLYFLGRRIYNPYADELMHDVAFAATTKPYAVVLSSDRLSPFAPLPADELGLETKDHAGRGKGDEEDSPRIAAPRPRPHAGDAPADFRDEPAPGEGEAAGPHEPAADEAGTSAVPRIERVRVDLDGLERRVVEIPVREGRYASVLATRERVFFLRRPLVGMATTDEEGEETRLGKLVAFELASREEKPWASEVRDVDLSADGSMFLVRGTSDLRLLSATKAPASAGPPQGKPGEKSGIVDLSRLRVRIDPRAEWLQIFREAWRQQRGHFWTETMTSVDWGAVHERYAPLARRVRTRDELSDLLWDMQGELGTSHAYVVGGDEAWRPHYRTGLLGADIAWDDAAGRYRIAKIHVGDPWSPGAHSPLVAPGLNVREGDFLVAVDGREAVRGRHPWTLMERPGPAVSLTVAREADASDARQVVVAPLWSEYKCRYREWIKQNQALVDERTGSRVGYVHVPDMMVAGLVEFHRAFLWQSHRAALIVDVRDNGGGNVSQILLEKLNRKLNGYVKARWAEPEPLPDNVIVGPMVALCNERTGSDGDIFCQSWKQLGLGPLIGKRTWGGVIGIDRSRTLVDGGYTTQPEYAYWFKDRGWEIEGSGVDPDIEVDVTPTDHREGKDPQLDFAITEVLRLMEERGSEAFLLPPPPSRA